MFENEPQLVRGLFTIHHVHMLCNREIGSTLPMSMFIAFRNYCKESDLRNPKMNTSDFTLRFKDVFTNLLEIIKRNKIFSNCSFISMEIIKIFTKGVDALEDNIKRIV